MWSIAFFLVAFVGLPSARADVPRASERQQVRPSTNSALLRVTVGYYLNDTEEDSSRHCQFSVLDGANIVAPTITTGRWHFYAERPGTDDASSLRIFIRCDDHVALVHPRYSLFSGYATVVLTAYTNTRLLGRDDPTRFPVNVDEHPLWSDYATARADLKREWEQMPVSLKGQVHVACCLTLSANEGDAAAMQIERWYR